jgi:hypothetical protein
LEAAEAASQGTTVSLEVSLWSSKEEENLQHSINLMNQAVL